ncbi:MAG: lysine--tRNA ligase, partial [Atopobium sp.]|nr:lysine--tRNA ligase [Atopobium sp.]
MSEVENNIAGNSSAAENAAATAADAENADATAAENVDATEVTSEASINDERAQRRVRRQALLDTGVDPYPIKSTVTAHVAELEERYADLE